MVSEAQPYVGPRPFKREDAPFFFGRDRETNELRSLIISHSEVLLYAQSGAGKTSLINAKLWTLLEDDDLEVLPIASVKGPQPPFNVANVYVFNTLVSWRNKSAPADNPTRITLREFLESREPLLDEEGLPKPCVAIFDQFEELFTSYPECWEQRRDFFVQVRDALDALPHLRALFAMREDYIAAIDQYASIMPEKFRIRFHLENLRWPQAIEAITYPLRGQNRHFANGVAEELVKELMKVRVEAASGRAEAITGEFVEPVQLQVVCDRLWRDLGPEDTEITLEHLKTITVEKALLSFYEESIKDVARETEINEAKLRWWFEQKLVTTAGTRGMVFRGERETEGLPNKAVDALDKLHLIRSELRGGSTQWYELTHDRFIDAIQKSYQTSLLALPAGAEEMGKKLETQAADWMRLNRKKSHLLGEVALGEAQRWLDSTAPTVLGSTERLRAFVEASHTEVQARAEAERRRAQGTREVASWGNVSHARDLERSGKNAQALAYLAQALRLNPENREATSFATAMLPQLSWCVPFASSMRHDREVTSAQFSPDGQRVVTASRDKTARLWDAANGKAIGKPMKHEGMVNSAQFSPDGQRIVTASRDNTARLWDAASGKPIGDLKHESVVNSAQFSPDGQGVVTASNDNTARLWDAANGIAISEPMKHEDRVNSAQFSPDGQRIVTASRDNTARLWDAASGKPIGEPMKHESAVYSAQFSPDGQRVVSASYDNTARLWDAASGKPIGDPMKHESVVNSARFNPDGQRVVTVSDDNTARLWDAASGKPIGEPIKHESTVMSAQFSPDGQRVVTASRDNTARLWDAANGNAISEPMKHESVVNSAQFSPDGQRVVTASRDNTARLWDAANGKAISEPMKHESVVNSAQFSPDGQGVVTASYDNTARLWDAAIMTDKEGREDILLLAELAEATGGITLEAVGHAEIFKLLTPEQIRASWEKIAAKFVGPSLKLSPLQRFMKWSVSDRRTRAISPFSQVTVSEWLENRIKEGTVEGLRAAIQVDPTNARVTAHLGRRLADYALKQGSDPDEARRARGQADFLTSRALKLAPDNDEVKKLRDEVVKVIKLNSY